MHSCSGFSPNHCTTATDRRCAIVATGVAPWWSGLDDRVGKSLFLVFGWIGGTINLLLSGGALLVVVRFVRGEVQISSSKARVVFGRVLVLARLRH